MPAHNKTPLGVIAAVGVALIAIAFNLDPAVASVDLAVGIFVGLIIGGSFGFACGQNRTMDRADRRDAEIDAQIAAQVESTDPHEEIRRRMGELQGKRGGQ